MPKHGKRYLDVTQLVDRRKAYPPQEAVAIIKKTANAKFDETIEAHLRTSADPRHAEQQIRTGALLPHGLGKQVRVLVFAQGDAAQAAREAGADFIGADDLIQKIDAGWVEFDITIATPDLMGRVGRLGRVLGRRGLMPNPRTGTVVQPQDIRRAVDEAKKGRVEVRLDRTAIIHAPIGKASFEETALMENLTALIDNINRNRPPAVKGSFIRSSYLTSTMGPSIKLDLSSLVALRAE
ncbi:MAG: 50S ribosomal protein L1 [Chloroflexi bacterium]|nr:50S ribosomal protein L1 [Chloroflexota bacterium]